MTTALEVRRPAPALNGNGRKELTPIDRFDLLIKGAKAALQDARDPVEVKGAIDQALIAEAVAKAHLSEEHVLFAQEVHVYACRRAGEMRSLLAVNAAHPRGCDWRKVERLHREGMTPGDIAQRLNVTKGVVWGAIRADFKPVIDVDLPTRMEFDDRFGVSHRTGKAWETLTKLTEPEFNAEVAELKRTGKISLNALLVRIGRRRTYVERGIYRLPDGRFLVQWEKARKSYCHTLKAGLTLEQARVELATMRGSIKPGSPPNGKRTAADAYAETRRAAQTVSNLLPAAPPGSRIFLAEAEDYLIKAAEALNRAILAQG